MRPALPFLSLCLAATSPAEEAANHRFDPGGAHQQAGFPTITPKIFAIAGKPVTLSFSGLATDWQATVSIQRVTSARRIMLPSVEPKTTDDLWELTWTPPETRGPAQYEIRLEGAPTRIVRIETRDPKWLETTREAIANADWDAQGLTTAERDALATLGIQTDSNKSATAILEMRPRQGDTARRRVVWDEENPALLVWRPGPAIGDFEARAPRWWISPDALATDHGLIRFLDLFAKPPLNP